MAGYHSQSVYVVIGKETDLYKKIENIAEQTGESIEQVFSSLATTGIYHHMLCNALCKQRALQLHGKEE